MALNVELNQLHGGVKILLTPLKSKYLLLPKRIGVIFTPIILLRLFYSFIRVLTEEFKQLLF